MMEPGCKHKLSSCLSPESSHLTTNLLYCPWPWPRLWPGLVINAPHVLSLTWVVLLSHLVVSDSLWSHGLRHTKLPCPSLPEFSQTHVYWLSDAIPPSHPLSPSSPLALSLSQHHSLFSESASTSGGQSIGASASASVLSMNIQCWFPLGLTSLNSCCSRDSQESPLAPQFKSTHFWHSTFFMAQLSHLYITAGFESWPSGKCGLLWWFSAKESTCQCRRHEFDPWVRKIP